MDRFRPLPAGYPVSIVPRDRVQAGVAQLVERRICNPQVTGSSPLASSDALRRDEGPDEAAFSKTVARLKGSFRNQGEEQAGSARVC